MYTPRSAHLKVVIQGSDGNPIVYEYKKQMPEDIVPERCTYKVIGAQCKENFSKQN